MRLTTDYIGEQFLRTVPNVVQGIDESGKRVAVEDFGLMSAPLCLVNITDSHFLFVNNINGDTAGARHILPVKKYDDENWTLYRELDKGYDDMLLQQEAEKNMLVQQEAGVQEV
jgi:hypothetical protein